MPMPSKTAVHEAGHAVTGIELGIKIISVDMTPQKSSREHMTTGGVTFEFKLKAGEEATDAIERKMTFGFGGMCAEEHILGIPMDSMDGIGVQTDDLDVIEGAAKCGRALGISEAEITQRWQVARHRAEEITVQKRDDILKIAQQLDKHGFLSADQIRGSLIEQSST